MDSGQAGLPEPGQLLDAFSVNVLGRTIHRNPFEFRKEGPCTRADMGQIIRGHGNGVSRREKKCLNFITMSIPGFPKIRLYAFNGTYTKTGTFLVDHAKGAFVVGATDCGLYEQAVRFAGGTVNGPFIMHGKQIFEA